MSSERPLKCTVTLLSSIRDGQEGSFFHDELYKRGMDEFVDELSGPNWKAAAFQFVNIFGMLVAHYQRPDLGQKLLTDIEPRLTPAHAERFQQAIEELRGKQHDQAAKTAQKASKAMPTIAPGEGVKADPNVKFDKPRGPVKG